MSPQIVELLIFAAIAFFIINKLISILGNSNDNDIKMKKGQFGEPQNLKDVTSSGKDWTLGPMLYNNTKKEIIDPELLVDPKNIEILEALEEISIKVDRFSLKNFMKNSAKAWQMVIKALQEKDAETISVLVDKRYLETIMEKRDFYKSLDSKQNPEIKISDVTFFGNSVMIKLLINAKGISPEEWTLTRNFNQTGPNWFVSNIDQYIS